MKKSPQAKALEAMGARIVCTFVPSNYSMRDEHPQVHWRVAIYKGGILVLETGYTVGCAHTLAYKRAKNARSMYEWTAVVGECNTGRYRNPDHIAPTGKTPEPQIDDVMFALTMDAGAINYPTFEDWAADYGFDPDSRKAETMYRECLATALKLRQHFDLDELTELFQDY